MNIFVMLHYKEKSNFVSKMLLQGTSIATYEHENWSIPLELIGFLYDEDFGHGVRTAGRHLFQRVEVFVFTTFFCCEAPHYEKGNPLKHRHANKEKRRNNRTIGSISFYLPPS